MKNKTSKYLCEDCNVELTLPEGECSCHILPPCPIHSGEFLECPECGKVYNKSDFDKKAEVKNVSINKNTEKQKIETYEDLKKSGKKVYHYEIGGNWRRCIGIYNCSEKELKEVIEQVAGRKGRGFSKEDMFRLKINKEEHTFKASWCVD